MDKTRTYSRLLQTNAARCAESKLALQSASYPGHRCPDFTLDVQQAEQVMKKIQERKKERCWCRLITSFVGFVFLLFSVMFFSMMFTRGDKMFGPL
ncbi:hypothetical protein V9T40_013149 [Parthenolecanium corni]|uniref:Uncharacterized protein n=1 Tax=Parthenolecanium corni TaxID=536013 RepID=A0AAN9TIK5_9HEMI